MSHEPSPARGDGYLQSLYQRAPFGYLITDDNDVVVRVNETLLSWAGFDEQRVVGRAFRDLLTPGSQLLYETKHLPVLRLQGFAQELFVELVTADGPSLPVLINAARVSDSEGEPGEVRIGVLDASTRVSYERELLTAQRTAEELAARVSVLQRASASFGSSTSVTQIAETLSSIIEDALVATAACVALVADSGSLDVVGGTNLLDGLILNDIHVVGRAVLQSEKPVIVGTTDDDEERYPWVVRALREARLRTLAVFPIMSDSKPVGVTAAFFARERSLAETECALVLAVAQQASQALTRTRAEGELAFAALHDQLTGLANRASLRESIREELGLMIRGSRPLSVMFLDLDGFKPVNDGLGHSEGDAILREVAKRLSASVRAVDIVGRYGGDEFVVVCAHTGADEAATIAARIHGEIRNSFAEAEGFPISASIGIATHESSDPRVSADAILRAADEAMYESKRLGRDRTTQVQV